MTWVMYFLLFPIINFPINITDDDLKITPQEIGKENDASPTQRNDVYMISTLILIRRQ